MQNISTYKRYFSKLIEVRNSEILSEPADYELTFPHSYDSSWTYKNIFAEVLLSDDFSGSVNAEFIHVINDSENLIYRKPVVFQQIDNAPVNITRLDETTSGTYKLLDNSVDKLLIRVTQAAPGNGKIIFVIRGL